jgi:hypothetical protein
MKQQAPTPDIQRSSECSALDSSDNLTESFLPCRPFPSLLTDEYKFHDNPSLIRFMSSGGAFDLIQNRRLRFSSVAGFRTNDPTEGLGGLPLRPEMLGYGSLIYSFEGNYFSQQAKPSKHFPANFWEQVTRKDYSSLREKIRFAKQASGNFLCSCFHVYHEEPFHMWELYGSRGAGLAIYTNKDAVLSALPSKFQDNLRLGWGEVFYAFNLAEASQLWDDAYLPESLIRIKSSRFKAEQEFRFFVKSKRPQEQCFLPFNPEAIEAIILGPRLSNNERAGLRSELLAVLQAQHLKKHVIDSEELQIRKLVEE